ncbi:MAG: transporter [Gemmatimonadota bacterium]
MMSRRFATVAGVVFTTLAASLPAAGQEVSYSGSLQYATGRYLYTERASSLFFFNGISAIAGPLRLSASVPVIMQSTAFLSYTGGGLVPSGTDTGMGDRVATVADTATYRQFGLGDPLAHADLRLLGEGSVMPAVRITADVKVPIADVERGFGTGEWDYAGGLSLSKSLGLTLVFLDVSYWVLGDFPDQELKDPITYSLAVGHPIARARLGLFASLFGNTEILDGVEPPMQLSLGLNYLVAPGTSISGSAAFGLTESSPDLSLSFGWLLSFR